MNLQWIKYGERKASKHLLILNLGTHNHKISAVICDKVPNQEVSLLREAGPILAAMPLNKIVAWIKQNCPSTYRLAYREFLEDKIRLIQQY